MQRWTVFTDNGFLKCSWAHVVISFIQSCWFLMQCCLRDQRSRAFSVPALNSLNLLMILWIVDGEIPKFLEIVPWEMLFLSCWTICPCSFSQSGEPHPILACERLSLSRMPLSYPIMILSPVTNEPVYLWNVPNRSFWSVRQLSQSFVAPVPTFLERVAGIKFRMSVYLQKTIKLISLNIKYLVFVLYSIELRVKRICESL